MVEHQGAEIVVRHPPEATEAGPRRAEGQDRMLSGASVTVKESGDVVAARDERPVRRLASAHRLTQPTHGPEVSLNHSPMGQEPQTASEKGDRDAPLLDDSVAGPCRPTGPRPDALPSPVNGQGAKP